MTLVFVRRHVLTVYAGLAFDFAHNPPHRKFIVELFQQYLEALQRQQKQAQRQAA